MSFHSRRASLLALVGAACRFDSWVGKIPGRRERLPTPVFLGFPCGSAGKESPCNAGDLDLIPGLGRSPGEWNGYPLQHSGLENPRDCIVHVVTKSWTRLSDFHFSLLSTTFSLDPFRIFILASAILIMICVGMDLFRFIFSGALCTSCT